MATLLSFIGYLVIGGALACLGVVATVPSVTGTQMVGWAVFILIGVPIILLVFIAALGINV